jgi:hypothetical protein
MEFPHLFNAMGYIYLCNARVGKVASSRRTLVI